MDKYINTKCQVNSFEHIDSDCLFKSDSPLHQFRPRGLSELVRACTRKRLRKTSVRFGARGHAMEVENISTSMACPRAPKRTESLVL